MSIKSADALTLKLQQDVLNELVTTNHLLQLISQELQQIKQLTQSGGEFETNVLNSVSVAGPFLQQIKQLTQSGGQFETNVLNNTELVKLLADMHQLDFEKIPPFIRMQIDLQHQSNQNNSYEEHDTFRNNSTMEEDK